MVFIGGTTTTETELTQNKDKIIVGVKREQLSVFTQSDVFMENLKCTYHVHVYTADVRTSIDETESQQQHVKSKQYPNRFYCRQRKKNMTEVTT